MLGSESLRRTSWKRSHYFAMSVHRDMTTSTIEMRRERFVLVSRRHNKITVANAGERFGFALNSRVVLRHRPGEKVSVNGIDIFPLYRMRRGSQITSGIRKALLARWPSDADSGTMGSNGRRVPKSGRRN